MTDHDSPLRRADLAAEPLAQFERWFEDARAVVRLPEAAAVATATLDGAPSVRMVLLKQVDDRGVVFHTNAASRKGHELDANPRAALVVYWDPFGRQVRIEGGVELVDEAAADAYFAGRARGAQIGAHASPQSEVIDDRAALEQRIAQVEADFEGREVPRPATWVGYRLVPVAWEFWQHRSSRLHDRFRYRRNAGAWVVERLAP